MSGRSAHVRKEKEKTKSRDGGIHHGLEHSPTILGDFPVPNGNSMYLEHNFPAGNHADVATIQSASSGSDQLASHGAYQHVRRPQQPIIVDSGIEKSSFRSLMDKKSEGARNVLSKTFGKKKKKEEDGLRPPSSATVRPYGDEMGDDDDLNPPAPFKTSRTQHFNQSPEYIQPGPPSSKLPPLPRGPQLKRWMGAGRPPQAWNKLRKDPELWDPNGDTLIYLPLDSNSTSRPPASLRVSSHAIEAAQSQYLTTILRQGLIEESFIMPPSPIGTPDILPAFPVQPGRRHQPTPPMSENSIGAYDGQILYEIYFWPPPEQPTKASIVQYQATTRNLFALLCKPEASLVGLNLYEALVDLQDRLEEYMPPDWDSAGEIIEWLIGNEIDDVRDNPSVAAGILAWSETKAVRWDEGWKEAYVHSAGMVNRLEATADFRFVSHITKAMLQRANLEIQVRVENCENRLNGFDFGDMWPTMTSQPVPARLSFERIRKFFTQFYVDVFGTWPPITPTGEEQWLTRTLTRKLQQDFGALYNYLVNREVSWDCSEERSGRKWNIIHAGNRSFDADTFDVPFTDILVAFDNRYRYPHIPHPYPLVPESMPFKNSKDNLFKTSKKSPKPEDKMTEKRVALAYTESTNMYLLGSDYVNNDMVDAFIRFEQADKAAEVDPFEARRGRWILIYGILQTLASISVDTPNTRYTSNVPYHLNPRLRGCPPWKKGQEFEEANHVGSFCWTIRDTWLHDSPIRVSRPRNPVPSTTLPSLPNGKRRSPSFLSSSPSYQETETIDASDAGSSFKNPLSSRTSKSYTTRKNHRLTNNSDLSTANSSGYGPGIERLEEEWPIREDSRASAPKKDFDKSFSMSDLDSLTIRDFDDDI